ncbi:hypothetical protein [Streptomyces alboflavus]|uniref:hypothetical protein n=1 Tax=Streptomyces alboflavus TaxID=67267 RepID=UPI0004C1F879|nr:hypothetical protein [Streptomyces alboflavus]
MSDSSMRVAKPSDLEHLAKLFDGRGHLQDRLDDAFTWASQLGVREKLGPIKPMVPWVTKTAPDLRKRAAIMRAGDGDPRAAALYAGFTPEQLKGAQLPANVMLIANASVTDPEEFDPGWLKKQQGETLSEWITRIKGDSVAKVTGNENLGEVVSDYIRLTALSSTAPYTFGESAKAAYSVIKRLKRGERFKAPGTTMAQIMRGQIPNLLDNPGTRRMAAIGARMPPQLLDFLAGSNRYAPLAGPGVRYSWQMNLVKVGKGQAALRAATGGGKFASFASGTGAALRTSGFWRTTGIAGSAAATGVGAFEVVQQGNPVEAFKRDKAGYTSDVSGTLFNASLTAAMINPNPVFIGAVIATGTVYGVSSIIDNWGTVKKFPGKVAEAGGWAARKTREGAGKLVSGGKKFFSSVNPF